MSVQTEAQTTKVRLQKELLSEIPLLKSVLICKRGQSSSILHIENSDNDIWQAEIIKKSESGEHILLSIGTNKFEQKWFNKTIMDKLYQVVDSVPEVLVKNFEEGEKIQNSLK